MGEYSIVAVDKPQTAIHSCVSKHQTTTYPCVCVCVWVCLHVCISACVWDVCACVLMFNGEGVVFLRYRT